LCARSDVLHPSRPNVAKDELREKLATLYKMNKDQVSVFGFRTQYGGGKSTGFALLYDSAEAMKKFEPHYRLVRYGQATKIEKASRQQRTYLPRRRPREPKIWGRGHGSVGANVVVYRQATQEPLQGVPWYRKDQGCEQGQEEISALGRDCWFGAARCNGFSYDSLACCMVRWSFCLRDAVHEEKHGLGVLDAEGVATTGQYERFCHHFTMLH
jgi:ribosomal protein S24E